MIFVVIKFISDYKNISFNFEIVDLDCNESFLYLIPLCKRRLRILVLFNETLNFFVDLLHWSRFLTNRRHNYLRSLGLSAISGEAWFGLDWGEVETDGLCLFFGVLFCAVLFEFLLGSMGDHLLFVFLLLIGVKVLLSQANSVGEFFIDFSQFLFKLLLITLPRLFFFYLFFLSLLILPIWLPGY